MSDRKDATVSVGAQRVITREVEASGRNAPLGTCFYVAVQDLNIWMIPKPGPVPGGKRVHSEV